MAHLFDEPTNLQAITINGAILVESDQDKKRNAERRAKRKSRWDSINAQSSNNALKKAKNSDASQHNRIAPSTIMHIPASPIVRDNPVAIRERKALLPATLDVSKTDKKTQQIYILRLQIQDCSARLSRSDLGIPLNPRDRSPSPEPIYNNQGVRINTRIDRTKNELISQRNYAITKLKEIDPEYQPPSIFKYKNVNLEEKVMIPASDYPHINFIGLILGPRGKQLEDIKAETQCQIVVRGKGSLRCGMTGIKKDGKIVDALDEPLHAWIQGTLAENVKKAVEKIQNLIDMEIYNPECEQMVALRAKHMHELAVLNGTVKGYESKCLNCGLLGHQTWQCGNGQNVTSATICSACGGVGHLTKDCRQRRPGEIWSKSVNSSTKELDQEYAAFMNDMMAEGSPKKLKPYFNSVEISGNIRHQSYTGVPSSSARTLLRPQMAGGNLTVMGRSIFGGKLTRMTSGFKSDAEIEMDKERKKKELENQPVPLEWRIQRYEKEYEKQQESYLDRLKNTVQQEKLAKAQTTGANSPIYEATQSISTTSDQPVFRTSTEFDLPNLEGNVLQNLHQSYLKR